jgi:hypothetical protein
MEVRCQSQAMALDIIYVFLIGVFRDGRKQTTDCICCGRMIGVTVGRSEGGPTGLSAGAIAAVAAAARGSNSVQITDASSRTSTATN